MLRCGYLTFQTVYDIVHVLKVNSASRTVKILPRGVRCLRSPLGLPCLDGIARHSTASPLRADICVTGLCHNTVSRHAFCRTSSKGARSVSIRRERAASCLLPDDRGSSQSSLRHTATDREICPDSLDRIRPGGKRHFFSRRGCIKACLWSCIIQKPTH
ncbi:hypothetical protein BC628DRAFT_1094318 [Trametes gibbosa]|nr:hypothetical protein BC628DRAFT_1094318 [Trametes gibbosa]